MLEYTCTLLRHDKKAIVTFVEAASFDDAAAVATKCFNRHNEPCRILVEFKTEIPDVAKISTCHYYKVVCGVLYACNMYGKILRNIACLDDELLPNVATQEHDSGRCEEIW